MGFPNLSKWFDFLSHVWGCGKTTTKTKKRSPNKLFILRGKNAKIRITVIYGFVFTMGTRKELIT